LEPRDFTKEGRLGFVDCRIARDCYSNRQRAIALMTFQACMNQACDMLFLDQRSPQP
jgi:hypothetical protein